MSKISIIIPVYNVQEYLGQCLESVLNQSLKDIEIICVDDCSKDSSLEILNRYAENDQRLKVYHFDKSKSALQARKLGVLESNSEYIMFLDADDYLELNACEVLYSKIKNEKVDILHFSSQVVNCANLSEKRIEYNQRLIAPYEKKLLGSKVFESCFIEKKFTITLWNKIFDANLCKKAFSQMVDKYLPKAQDLYSFYVIAYYAQSYFGWNSDCLHYYCFGRGVTGTNSMNLDKFERYCTQANIAKELSDFSKNNNIKHSKEIVEKYQTTWLKECVNIWKNELPNEYTVEGLDILYKYWDSKAVIALLAQNHWFDRSNIAIKLKNMKSISLKENNVKTIAIYYHHFTIGGVQRVISLLAPMFEKMGFKVILIADNEPTDNDIPLPNSIERITIMNRDNVNKDNFIERLKSWATLKEKYNFDLVLYNTWTSNILLWDIMYLKSIGVPVFIHAHSVFSFSINKYSKLFYEMPKTFAIADGMIVLSKVDKLFWDAYVNNVHYIPNPISENLKNINPVKWDNNALIWVGRVSDEKQPEAIFKIMEKVVKQLNDSKIYLLGNFDDQQWKDIVRDKNLEKNIIFCGLVHNVNDYFEKASIHLSTSKYEGFPMTLLEAQAHGLPTVMFEMPYLELGKEECGVIGIDMLDYNAAANEIIKLLTDKQYWDEKSTLARNSYESLENYDYYNTWKDLLKGNEEKPEIDIITKNMIHTIVNHYCEGFIFQEKKKKKLRKQVSAKKLLSIKYWMKLIRRGINSIEKYGFKYTLNKIIKKVLK